MRINDFIDFQVDNIIVNGTQFPNTEENTIRYVVPYIHQLERYNRNYFFRYVASDGWVEVLKCLPNEEYSTYLLCETARCKQFEVVKYLCEKQTPLTIQKLNSLKTRTTPEIYEYLKEYYANK